MASKFYQGQNIFYQASDAKYKGTMEKVNPKGYGVYEYDLDLTAKRGTDTTTSSPTKALSTEVPWEGCKKAQRGVGQHNLTAA